MAIHRSLNKKGENVQKFQQELVKMKNKVILNIFKNFIKINYYLWFNFILINIIILKFNNIASKNRE